VGFGTIYKAIPKLIISPIVATLDTQFSIHHFFNPALTYLCPAHTFFIRLSTTMTSRASQLPESLAKSIANSKAEYRQLGKSGLRVSVPIFGAMSIGHKAWMPWLVEEQEALPLLKAAFDRGLNTWDTANVYSNGVSEKIIGKAMKTYDIPRHKVVLLSKCWGYVGESPEIWDAKYPEEIKKSKDYINQAGE
jgi:hypothetical protein